MYRRLLVHRWFFAGTVVALVAISAELALAQGPIVNGPTNIINQYRSVRTAWLATAAGYANRLFGILALIEFAWTGIVLLLDKTELQGWTSALIRRMMFVGAFFALLQFGTTWIPAIIDSFVTVGQVASGVAALSPSAILARGLEITGDLLVGAAQSGWLAAFGTALCMVFAALLSFLAFLGLSIQFVVTIVESYLVIGAGFLFLGFGGSRWTPPYVERYIAYAVSAGVKIMLIYLLIGAGYILSAGWVTAAQNIAISTQPATDALDIAASAVIFLMICWNAPKLAAAILGGAPALTGGDAVSTGGALLGGAVAVAGLAAGGVALGAKMLAAKGGAMAVGQAANMGAGGGAGGAGVAAGVGAGGGEAEEPVGRDRLRLCLRAAGAVAPMARRVAALNRHRHPRDLQKALCPRPAVAADRLRHQVVQVLESGLEHLPRPSHRRLHPQVLEIPHPLPTPQTATRQSGGPTSRMRRPGRLSVPAWRYSNCAAPSPAMRRRTFHHRH